MQKLPPAFCEEIKQEKSKTAILESRKGRWRMDVCRKDDEIHLQDGWPQFADCHALSDRDLLVLEHTRHFHFHVTVFDSSACEKMFVGEPCEEAKSKAPSGSCSKTKQSLHPSFTMKITAFSAGRGAIAVSFRCLKLKWGDIDIDYWYLVVQTVNVRAFRKSLRSGTSWWRREGWF